MASICAASSMNALPRPSSSDGSAAPDLALRAANSPITFALFSAADASDCASATGSSLAVFGGGCRHGSSSPVLLVNRETAAAVRRAQSRNTAAMPQMIEVRDRLAHREKALLQVELAPEQHGHHVGRGHGRRARRRWRPGARRAAPRDARAVARRVSQSRGTEVRATAAPESAAAAIRTTTSEARKRPSGSPLGSDGHTETLVLILGSSMSPAMSTSSASQNSAACSDECP